MSNRKFRSHQKAVVGSEESDPKTYMMFSAMCVGFCSPWSDVYHSPARISHSQDMHRTSSPQGMEW